MRYVNAIKDTLSPLAWGRGLKLYLFSLLAFKVEVAPRVGAWIETLGTNFIMCLTLSPLVWGRGLKHYICKRVDVLCRRPPRGGVD